MASKDQAVWSEIARRLEKILLARMPWRPGTLVLNKVFLPKHKTREIVDIVDAAIRKAGE